MYTVSTMHVIFVVNCWINMRPLNRTQIINLQLYSNQLTNQNFWDEGGPKNTFAPSPPICRSVPACNFSFVKSWAYYQMDLAYQLKKSHSCCVASWENGVTLMSLFGC